MTELKKDVAKIIEIVKGEGVKERVFSAKSSYYNWSKEERDLKAKVENVRERKLMTLRRYKWSVTITLRTTIEVKEKFDEMKKEKGLTASELLEMLLNKKWIILNKTP